MRKTEQISETADSRSTGAATHGAPPTVGAGAPLIRQLIRLVRPRPPKAVAGEDVNDAATPRGRGTDHASDAVRSPMDTGITRGASLWFGARR